MNVGSENCFYLITNSLLESSINNSPLYLDNRTYLKLINKMKKYLILLIIPLLFSCNTKDKRIPIVFDEFIDIRYPINDPIIKNYNGKLFNGIGYIEYQMTKNIQWEGRFKDGFLNGNSISYYDSFDNKIEEKDHYVDGERHGRHEKYSKNGQLIEEGDFLGVESLEYGITMIKVVNFNILLNTINIIGFNLYNLSTQTSISSHSTVTDLAKFLGWSTLQPLIFAM